MERPAPWYGNRSALVHSNFFVSSAGSTTTDAIDSVATLTADTTPIDRSGG